MKKLICILFLLTAELFSQHAQTIPSLLIKGHVGSVHSAETAQEPEAVFEIIYQNENLQDGDQVFIRFGFQTVEENVIKNFDDVSEKILTQNPKNSSQWSITLSRNYAPKKSLKLTKALQFQLYIRTVSGQMVEVEEKGYINAPINFDCNIHWGHHCEIKPQIVVNRVDDCSTEFK